MKRDELSDRLNHLDPGATLKIGNTELLRAFDVDRFSSEALKRIEAFALEHRCTFSMSDHEECGCFEKNDVF